MANVSAGSSMSSPLRAVVSRASPFDLTAEPVKRFEKGGAVSPGKGGVVALAFARLPQVRPEVSHRRSEPDIRLVEDPAGGPGDECTGGDAAPGKRHIGGDDDIAFACMLGDPIVRCVETRRYDDIVHHRVTRRPQPRIGDEGDFEAVAFGHLEDFRLHRAGIGIDIDHRQSTSRQNGKRRNRSGAPIFSLRFQ
ncbi:hypothetical protein SFHH103_01111 [Sinorhizobium fredii HH103]|uniref:Uncharacterized protein n=1 Tax=Sinorhizobium fredii (strain HH103) TaxID=1117943 RepID=G9A4W6_SINF1|nr:hypothetical protein SFHH103_01111 [Sinorhizobium fredii HH103]